MCVQNHECLLGEVVDGKMKLNDRGKMVKGVWKQMFEKYPDIDLGEYSVMPNHLHGIVVINAVGAGLSRPNLKMTDQKQGRDNRAPTLGQMIAYFKYQTTIKYNTDNLIGRNILWQRNYYEHIIRNEKDYWAIRQYIRDNPINWEADTLYRT